MDCTRSSCWLRRNSSRSWSSHPDVFEITGRIVGGEQHFHSGHRVTAARLLEELFTPNPTFRLPEIELVNA